MKSKDLCCMLDPLRGCRICGWQVCSYHYMVLPYVGDRRSVSNIHDFVTEAHASNTDWIIVFRSMTYSETLIGKNGP